MNGGIPIHTHQDFMQRCLQLARLGAGHVAPNPMVGAVLVHKGEIIGEGYHQLYGKAHAEVNCIEQAIANGHADKFPGSVMYVTLEPCAHFGKTPPCANLIIHHHIPEVVIGSQDPFEQVDGKGIEKLQKAGVKVTTGVLEKECLELNKRFFTFHTLHRPYIILKWAQTADARIGTINRRLLISNEYSNRLVHKWRSEEQAILIGTNTALADNPELTTRLWPGKSPIRLVIDMELKLPASLKIFAPEGRVIVFNTHKQGKENNIDYYQVTEDTSIVHQILNALRHFNIQSVLVEGGAQLLQSFIDEDAWDEIRRIENLQLTAGHGLPAPIIRHAGLVSKLELGHDSIQFFEPDKSIRNK
ncbi:MAG TPA: bifunctional diaminohydroxyphosphoribosylaminopyrimidine deaminase/5-amino-6-(5-phosphoribosylamino)uracil reductase RibD [Chitinophagaceae bacterium]|nr:bifunctional diaminohydroxyphosphoribosylaminopyrimidine deaminase/5-amino-6-(5-phosphoribosylamino)uracil reductase RibD [Chitinophagaceae bacterium]